MVGLKAENAFPPWLAQSSSLHRPRPLPKDGTAHSGLGLLTSVNKMPYRHGHRPS